MSCQPTRAALYVRMSTEHQQYSTQNQEDVLEEYARTRKIQTVRTFCDAGKSGLRIDGRDALKELIAAVQSGSADFSVILVYDVSRWGRFQDADESAHYEFICKRAGINVVYCAEQFENDGSPASTIVKSVKRAMAGEYSRELSVKVFKGQCKLSELGFVQGGAAGFGLQRMLVDQAGKPKSVLLPGEHKCIQTDRVVLVPGPEEERAVVRRIFQLFVQDRRTEREIAVELRRDGILLARARSWSHRAVHRILTNEKYIGNNVYNRISYKLRRKRVLNPPETWVRRNGAFEPIIDASDFAAARAIILERRRRISDEELLTKLRDLAGRVGRLSRRIIDESKDMPSSDVYCGRFGSLTCAYQQIAYRPGRDESHLEIERKLRELRSRIVDDIVCAMESQGGAVERDVNTGFLWVNSAFSLRLVVVRCQMTSTGALRWRLRRDPALNPDITVAVRMDALNRSPLDYFVFPSLDMGGTRLSIKEDNGLPLDGYRFDSLDCVFGMARTVRAGGAL